MTACERGSRIGARKRPRAVTISAAPARRPLEKSINATRSLPWLTALSATAAILAFIGVLPASLAFLFKPLTTVLIIAFAWPRGEAQPMQRRWVRAGLLLSLVGDVALLWPTAGFLPGLIAFLLVHLAYIAAFCVPARFAARPLAFVAYALLAAIVLSQLWAGVPAALRAPVVAYVLCLAAMASQAAVWWRVATGGADAALARHAAIGGMLFMASDSLLAINRFAVPLPLSSLWILLTYWVAQWCIAASLRAR